MNYKKFNSNTFFCKLNNYKIIAIITKKSFDQVICSDV